MEAQADGPHRTCCARPPPPKVEPGLALSRHPRRRAEDPLRPGHRPHGLGSRRASSSRNAAIAVHQRGPRRLSEAVAEFETTVPGIYVIGALAGYPLIKHCMNQGYDVIEFINGNTELKPADEPILEEKFAGLPGQPQRSTEWLGLPAPPGRASSTSCRRCRCASSCSIPSRSPIAPARSMFERNDPGSSLFAIADGSVLVEVDPDDPSQDRADRPGLDLRRGRADLGPPARRHRARRRGRDRASRSRATPR